LKYLIIFFFLLFPLKNITAQSTDDSFGIEDNDLEIGGDIFSDFNEGIVGQRMAEDERFYRYGRFFTFAFGLGLTTFDGNRGIAYENEHPSYGLNLNYFMDFQTSFGIGLEFSKHHFFIDQAVNGFDPDPPGLIRVNALRVFFSYRYYVDTSNLGTAITYAHPYFTGRLEYWYLSNKFEDLENFDDDSGGGLGFGLGFGGEFPIKIKETYINVELLYHSVNFHDKFTQKYAPLDGSTFGFDDLTGNSFTTMVYYVFNW